MPKSVTPRQALAFYAHEAPGVRFHMWARNFTCPMDRIAEHVPVAGRILDVGCGHGLFTNMMAAGSPDRQVFGVDPMASKIAVAQRVGKKFDNVHYTVGTIADVDNGPYDVITILDVLYLLPPPAKRAVLQECRALLKPEGRLVLKTNDRHPRWKYLWARFQERVMTGLGLTKGEGLYFFNTEENRALLEEAGFEAEIFRLDIWLPCPHVLFVSRRRNHALASSETGTSTVARTTVSVSYGHE